ncbi:MAG: fluoride efflux transporter CrcB [Hyphomicrobiaceae bacterium]
MRLLLLACAGGAIGAGLRHLVNTGAVRLLGIGLPWGTVFVNVVGSFLMGFLVEALALRFDGSPELRVFLATGILGGLTTFSAFSLDFAVLLQRGDHLAAALYLAGSVVISILALFAGLATGRMIFA